MCAPYTRKVLHFKFDRAMQKFQIGANVSDRDRTFEYAMTVEFDERTDLDNYLQSEYHEQFVIERFRPLISQRAIATIDVRS